MPTYRFECDECGAQALKEMTFEEHDLSTYRFDGRVYLNVLTHQCPEADVRGGWMQVFDFTFKRGMPEHYNHTTDTYVRGESDFISDLHRKSDEMSVRMGFDVAYEAVDGHDKEALGVTDDGLEDTERRLVNSGKVQPKLYL